MYNAPDMKLWQGRIDNEETPALRWHQAVSAISDSATAGIALLGINSDEGVKRNHGRLGASEGATELRKYLGPLAWHSSVPVYDAGNIVIDGNDLETLSNEQAESITQLLNAGHFPIVVGGGHEVAFGSFCGLKKYLLQQKTRPGIGIINFDAHFDLRLSQTAHSGTPFLQIARQCQINDIPFHYSCLGVSQCSNTQALFHRAETLGVQYLLDEQMVGWNVIEIDTFLKEFISEKEAIYLSIDLDVLPAAICPGVSAPAARGISLEILEYCLRRIQQWAGPRLKLADIAEYNPRFDPAGHTGKVTARLCHLLSNGVKPL